jgi:gliding motility-associated-like protein
LFHMAMMNSTAHDWGDGEGYRLMGSYYGYFSKFSDNLPTAVILNNNDTSITVSAGTEVNLLAGGGYEFDWTGYAWNGNDWVEMEYPYFMNNTSVENPSVIINNIGIYKYTASITTECYGVQSKSVLIKIVEPANLNDIYDTVCATPPYTDISEYYNLYNLNDTIVGKQGLLTGYYVDTWYKTVYGYTEIWDDFELNRNFVGTANNGSISVEPNPIPDVVNGSTTVGHLQKTSMNADNPASLEPGYTNWDEYNQSVWYDIDLTETISLDHGTEFSFDIMFDGTTLETWELGNHMVYLELFDASGSYARLPGGTLSGADLQNPSWQTMNFDFSGYDLEQITKVRVRVYTDNYWAISGKMPWGYNIDNLTRKIVDHDQLIVDPYNYRVTDGDTIKAKVLNQFDLSRSDSAYVYMTVLPPGKDARNIVVTDTCASNGNQLFGFDLTQYNYDVGGALIANREWYLDESLTQPVDDPTNVTVTGTQTFWAFIEDECGHIGSLTIEVSEVPVLLTDSATTEVCEVVPLGGDRGILDLTSARDLISSDAGATIMWYTDENFTTPVVDETQVFVSDGDVFYAELYNNPLCAVYSKLTVTVIPLEDIVFDDFAACEDAGNIILSASPAGGTFTGDGVTGNVFDPSIGEGIYELTYTIENQGCSHLEHANATVYPEVSASIIQNPAGQLQVGESANLEATILPAPDSQYSYTWSDAANLTNANTLSPTTVALSEPTFFTLDVVNDITGCTNSTDILVDVYEPVEVNLDFSANPICAGEDVIISAVRTGGFGPYNFDWTIPVGVDYTVLTPEGDQIQINNPQSTFSVSVMVTDLGITPNDVVSASDDLIVYPNPTISITPPEPSCENTDIEINPVVSGGTPQYTHEWSQDVQILETTTSDDHAIVNTDDFTGTYYLQYSVVDQNNCTAQENVEVVIYNSPVVSVSAPDKVCVGESVQLEGTVVQGNTSGGAHSWFSPNDPAWLNDLSSTIIPNPYFQTNTFGFARFQYIFTDANGCADTSDVAVIQVQSKPTVTIDPVGPLCVSSQGVQLNANPEVLDNPSATFEYDWTGDVVSTLENPTLSIATPGTKTVNLVVTADNGCESDMANQNIVVNPNPVAEIINQNPITVCELSDLELLANAGQPNVTYSWSGTAGTYISPSVGATVIFNAPAVNPITDYTVILEAENTVTGCTSQTEEIVSVYKSPVVTLGDDIDLCVGQDTILYPTIDFAHEPYTSKWLLDTTELSNTQTLNPRFTLPDNETYTVGITITDVYGCTGYDEISINPLENPIADAGLDRNVDWNTTFNLNGSASEGTPSYVYEWQPEDSIITSNLIPNPTSVLKESTQFALYVEDANGCFDYDTVLITVIGQPITVLIDQQPEPLCFGNTATLTAIASGGSGVYTYEWFELSSPGTIIATTQDIEVNPTSNTEYGVRVRSASFDPAEATKLVEVFPLPTISVQGGVTPELCLGNTYEIIPDVSGTAPYTYEWSDGGPITIISETYMFNNSQTSGDQTINLTVTDALGCEDDIDVTVTVNPLPQVDIIPDNPYVCINEALPLEAVVSGNGTAPYIYTWSPLTGNLLPSGSDATFTGTVSGTFPVSVAVRDANNCRANSLELVTVNPYPSLNLLENTTVCAGDDMVLDINPNNITGNYTMHWVGGDVNRIVDSTDIFRSVFRSDNEGAYELYYSIEDEYGCPLIDTVIVDVYPAVTLAPIADINACAGVGMDIQAQIIEGNPSTVTYSWIGQVVPTSGQQTTFKTSTPGTYPVEVIAGDPNCSDNATFTVTVHQNPRVSIANSPLMQVDFSANVMLQGNIQRYTTAPYTFSWIDPADIQSGEDTQTPITLPVTNTVDYSFAIEDAYGCRDTANITLQTEMIIIVIYVPEDPEDDPRIPKTEVADSTEFELTPNSRELCIGESVVLVPQFVSGESSDLTYTWHDDEGNFVSNDINPEVTPTKKYTMYTISNPAGFSTSASYRVIAHPNPSAHISVYPDYDGTFYIDDVFTLNGNPSGGSDSYVSHAWTATNAEIDPTDRQTVSMTVESLNTVSLSYSVVDSKGCEASATRSLPISEQVTPSIIGYEACEGATLTYSLTENYPIGTIFIWSQSGGAFVGPNQDVDEVQVYWPSATETGNVSVDIFPPNDRPLYAEIDVRVGANPDVEISGPVHVCVDEIENYIAINKGQNENLVYSWQVASDIDRETSPYYDEYWDGQNDSLLIDISQTTEQSTVHWKNEGDDKVVLRARDAGCISTVDLDVHIHPLPEPDFVYESVEKVYFQSENSYRYTDSIFVDKQVDFMNTTFPDTAINENVLFFWDFVGDGVYTENSYNTSYQYDESGNFMVHLMAVDEQWGCESIIAKPLTVVVNPNCGLTFPNAFTPEMLQDNEFYPVYNEGVMETGYELRVYNRWGALLWSTKNIHDTWDGMYKGEIAKQDVYVYHCKATCEEKDPETGKNRILNIKGDVTVIR